MAPTSSKWHCIPSGMVGDFEVLVCIVFELEKTSDLSPPSAEKPSCDSQSPCTRIEIHSEEYF